MKEPTLKELDEIRTKGFRPGVVCFCVHENKLLLLFKKEYKLWLLPQGGVENNETPADAIRRELTEELGKTFSDGCDTNYIYLGDGEVTMNKKFYGERDVQTDEGVAINMTGKKYFLYVLAVKSEEIDIKETKFDEFFWADYTSAKFLLGKSYQVNKRDLNLKFLDKLKEGGLII